MKKQFGNGTPAPVTPARLRLAAPAGGAKTAADLPSLRKASVRYDARRAGWPQWLAAPTCISLALGGFILWMHFGQETAGRFDVLQSGTKLSADCITLNGAAGSADTAELHGQNGILKRRAAVRNAAAFATEKCRTEGCTGEQTTAYQQAMTRYLDTRMALMNHAHQTYGSNGVRDVEEFFRDEKDVAIIDGAQGLMAVGRLPAELPGGVKLNNYLALLIKYRTDPLPVCYASN